MEENKAPFPSRKSKVVLPPYLREDAEEEDDSGSAFVEDDGKVEMYDNPNLSE